MTDKKLPTVDIHGKEYVMVKDRILAFNDKYSNGCIQTDILTNDARSVVVRATVRTDAGINGRTFIGHSEAVRGNANGITGQSPVEVAETSAVGRALGMLGIGILESVASADEIRKAPVVAENATVDPNAPSCAHGKMVLRVSRSAKNPNRQYYGCPAPKESACPMATGFVWLDEMKAKEQIIDEEGDVVVNDPDLPF